MLYRLNVLLLLSSSSSSLLLLLLLLPSSVYYDHHHHHDYEDDYVCCCFVEYALFGCLQGLTITDLEDLLEDIRVYLELEEGKNADYWRDIITVTEDELQKLRKLDAANKGEFICSLLSSSLCA